MFRTVRALVRRNAIADEIKEELDGHLDARIAQYEAEGLSPEDARRFAHRRVGNLAAHRDRGYDVRGAGVTESVLRDIRYACRLFTRQPAFTAAAVLTMALGLGATTAVFSIADAAVLRPLPWPDPARLVDIEVRVPEIGNLGPSARDVNTWTSRADGPLSHIAINRSVFPSVVFDAGRPERLEASEVTIQYFDLLGVAPLAGRLFSPDDMTPNAPPVLVLSHGFWQSRFAGDRNVIGRVARVNGALSTIIGVLPPPAGRASAIWRPLQVPVSQESHRGMGWQVVGRMRKGASPDAAAEWLKATLARDPAVARIEGVSIRLMLDRVRGFASDAVSVLTGVAILVLVLGCANVGGLIVARSTTREHELAIRAALGAGRGRLVRQLITEGTLLASLGGCAGTVLAWLTTHSLVAILPIDFPPDAPVQIGGRVLLMTLATTILVGLLMGWLPAASYLRTARFHPGVGPSSPSRARRGGVTSPRLGLSRRGGQAFILIQVALALVLLAGAGLMLKSSPA